MATERLSGWHIGWFLFLGSISVQTLRADNGLGVLSPAQLSSLLSNFEQEQQSLAQSLQSLAQQGITTDQLNTWQQQNASVLASQQQRAQTISESIPVSPLTYLAEVDIPNDATQAMEDFLGTRANLYNLWAELYNQELQASSGVDLAGAFARFEEQNAYTLQIQSAQVLKLAQEAASKPMLMPPALSIPTGASSQLTAFLTLRDQLSREEINVNNQLQANETERQYALQAWRQANASELLQLRKLALSLGQGVN